MKRIIYNKEKNKLFDLLILLYKDFNQKNINVFHDALKKLGFNIQQIGYITKLINRKSLTRDKLDILLTYQMRDDVFYDTIYLFLNISDDKEIDDYIEELEETEYWEKSIIDKIKELNQQEQITLKIGPNDINNEKINILAEAITFNIIEVDDIIWLLKNDIMININNNDFDILIYVLSVFNDVDVLPYDITAIEHDEEASKVYHHFSFEKMKMINEYMQMKLYKQNPLKKQ
ncbi:MAG: hypothetical protein WDA21_04750 [Bacilli bacterium]